MIKDVSKWVLNKVYYPRINSLKNSAIGKRCFILGNGPSLRDEDLQLLRRETVFATNRFMMHPQFKIVSPEYYCLSDIRFFHNIENESLMNKLSGYLFERKDSRLVVPVSAWLNRNLKEIPQQQLLYLNLLNNERVWEMSGELNLQLKRGVPWGHTVIIDFCLPLAFHMGYEKVYLLGCDMDYNPKSGATHFYGERKHARMDAEINTRSEWYQFVAQGYKVYKDKFNANGRQVYNSTLGGKLEVFPRRSLGQVLQHN